MFPSRYHGYLLERERNVHVPSCRRQIPLSESSMDGIAGRLLSRSIQNLPLNEPVCAAERYREASAKQVRRAFAIGGDGADKGEF